MTRDRKLLQDFDAISLINGIPSGVALLDNESRIIGMNAALEALCGFSAAEARGIDWHFIIRARLDDKIEPVTAALESNRRIRGEGDIIARNREKIPVMITASPIAAGKEGTSGIVLTVEDISLLHDINKKISYIDDYGDFIGHSPLIQKIKEILPVIAQTDSSVLITGETGTGKDLVGAMIHRLSPRTKEPFIKVNCGALPETLLESELFGHKRGAFTGADQDKPGRFQLAEGGTLYLTEIGDLPLPLQVKLLTVLDDKEVVPLGGVSPAMIDARVVAATHRDLETMVNDGTFRKDLLYRLNVVRIDVPPLKQRGDDIKLLLDHFFKHFLDKFARQIKGFSEQAYKLLLDYQYPGNVRELKNIIEYAVGLCDADEISIGHLPEYVRDYQSGSDLSPMPAPPSPAGEPLQISADDKLVQAAIDEDGDWEQVERKMITRALVQSRGNRSRAAGILGWGRSTLWRKMKKYGLL